MNVGCSSCGFENPAGMRFCGQCGTPLPIRCSSCDAELPAGFAFCGMCGASVASKSATLVAPVPPPAPAWSAAPERERDAERRQLTVLFCDLVGSTALSEQLDPEDLREVVRAYQAAADDAIDRYGGHVAQYLGDGLLVYFGYPLAHDDDAVRAVHSALAIVQGVDSLADRLERGLGVRLAVRIGIHTGLVVVGEMGAGGRHERLAMGDTPNVAARLQGLAEKNTVVVSAATQRLVSGQFESRALGSHVLKGVSVPLDVYEVVGPHTAADSSAGPFIGREQELGLILDRWQQAAAGSGQMILIQAEAGIGKSRLIQATKAQIGGEMPTVLEYRCSPYYQNTPLYPVIDLIHARLGFAPDDSPEEKGIKLMRRLQSYPSLPSVAVPLFASLLSVPLPESVQPRDLTPQRQRELTLEVLLAWLLELAAAGPILLLAEDLHWADPTTLELLGMLIDQAPATRIMGILTFRPEFDVPWGRGSHVSHITLNRLSLEQTEELVKHMTSGRHLPPAVMRQILDKTDGVPLFVEELVKMVLESDRLDAREGHVGTGAALPELTIPSTLQGSLMARLDRLNLTKDVAQMASVLGREFSYKLLEAISPLDAGSLQEGLNRLVDTELLYRRGIGAQATFIFKHALIGDAAYQSLLKSARLKHHRKVAEVLETRFPERAEQEPELLARHYTEAQDYARAISYWDRAGRRALNRFALEEAEEHFNRGLELVERLGPDDATMAMERSLQLGLGLDLMYARGYGNQGVEDAFTRAYELCTRIGDVPEIFPAMYGLATYNLCAARLDTAVTWAEQLVAMGERTANPIFRLEGHYLLGMITWLRGEPVAGRSHLELALSFHDPSMRRTLGALTDPEVACIAFATPAIWLTGFPELAEERARAAVERSRTLGDSISLVTSLGMTALAALLAGDIELTEARARESHELASRNNIAFWGEIADIILRVCALSTGAPDRPSLTELRSQIDICLSRRIAAFSPYWLVILGKVQAAAIGPEAGRGTLDEALLIADEQSQHFADAEIHRIRGDILVAEARVRDAEESFRTAIEIAERQGSRMFQLRATVSLARLIARQGRAAEALQILSDISDWFTEGYETADLREAHCLIDELSVTAREQSPAIP